MAPVVIETVDALRTTIANWRKAGDRIAYVPTMGALHEGHVSLVHLALERAERVIVSIFVNPTQFAPTEDLGAYPRTFEADKAALAEAKADAIFFPSAKEMYQPGAATTVSLAGPATVGLEDRFRPTHFSGVATVVSKLLIQALPDFAMFGEKDYQQLCVVKQMVRDLDIPTEIIPGPTVRAASGLALSSRNAYMTAHEREEVAPVLNRSMLVCAKAVRGGASIAASVAKAADAIEAAGFVLDYLELRHAGSLAQPEGDTCLPGQEYRLLVAARLPKVRLIDNIAV